MAQIKQADVDKALKALGIDNSDGDLESVVIVPGERVLVHRRLDSGSTQSTEQPIGK